MQRCADSARRDDEHIRYALAVHRMREVEHRDRCRSLLGQRKRNRTYVATWSGFGQVAFITDVFSRRIVGWNVASTLKADVLPLQALEMAAWGADGDLSRVTHHSDHGSKYMSLVYSERMRELGAMPSTGAVGDSYDNALAETVNRLYKAELIRRRGPWRTVEEVELATLQWVWRWNSRRLSGSLNYQTPVEVEVEVEVENDYYAMNAQPAPVEI